MSFFVSSAYTARTSLSSCDCVGLSVNDVGGATGANGGGVGAGVGVTSAWLAEGGKLFAAEGGATLLHGWKYNVALTTATMNTAATTRKLRRAGRFGASPRAPRRMWAVSPPLCATSGSGAFSPL